MGAVKLSWQVSFAPLLETPGRVRAELRRWLSELQWPAAQARRLVSAVNEAVTNAVEHGYPVVGFAGGVVTVTAELVEDGNGLRRVRVRVSDDGWWRPRLEPSSPPEHAGLTLIATVMDEVQVRRGEIGEPGTEIVMLSPPVRSLMD
ncbi:ATP-binding protein [Pseudonocardia halophobica]|uniref:ATP-binding protein n=1 Tax=Pseudonocardia halophobica TaxID=29401 RepID=UPI003D8F6F01